MNGYLFGCVVLGSAWLLTLILLRTRGQERQLPEFLWASFTCSLLGFTEFLFVPEYWDPPSIFKVGRWDLESFPFCFFTGGITAVLTELPWLRRIFSRLVAEIEGAASGVAALWYRITGGAPAPVEPAKALTRGEIQLENMLLLTFFLAAFGFTAQLNLNIIYDAALVCLAAGALIAWRRPDLRWQILGGACVFTVVYSSVLLIVKWFYPDFFSHWNHAALSGRWFLGAPAEEYLYAFSFGTFWAPLYEAWRHGD